MISGKFIWPIALLALLFAHCRKQNETANLTDCEAFALALTADNVKIVQESVNKACGQVESSSLNAASKNLETQLQKLVNQLNQNCQVNASIVCAACIQTSPPQSEIRIEYYDNGQPKYKIIDILSPANFSLSFIDMHD